MLRLSLLQHYKIIHSKTSQGLSPLFLLLGSTSAASGMLNVYVPLYNHLAVYLVEHANATRRITLQWLVIRCCKYLSPGHCVESLGAVWIVGLQWLFFTTVYVRSLGPS